jgi:hypothetical protein
VAPTDPAAITGLEPLRWLQTEGRDQAGPIHPQPDGHVHTTLTVGVSYTTLELKVNCIRAAHTNGQTLTATGTGTVIHAGRRIATAEGRVLDEHGMLIAHATNT